MNQDTENEADADLFPPDGGMTVIYDGECPLCSAYVRVVRLRDIVDHLELVDARDSQRRTQALQKLGYNLNDGMIVLYNRTIYHGADGVHIISMLSGRSGFANGILRLFMSNKSIAKFSYPLLRAGRNLLLRIRGVEQIASL